MTSRTLPVRSWRWLWWWQAARALSVVLLAIPVLVLYLPARGIVAAFDWWGSQLGSARVRCYNHDLARTPNIRSAHGPENV
jgi:hypothetical protein